MAGLARFIDVLRLFGEDRSDWTVPDMADALGVPASTVYRTVRELLAAGFLEPAREGHYRLGALFVEYDRLIRKTDPLVRHGQGLLRDVALQARVPCAAVLCRLYGDTVMCVAEETAQAPFWTSYERGLPRPLTRGATSKVILAQLPARRLTRLLAQEDGPFASTADKSSADKDAAALREELAAIRRRGYCVARGEVDRGLMGLAVPVAIPELALNASLSLIVKADLDQPTERRLVLLLVSSASLLGEALTRPDTPAAGSRTP